MQTSAERSGALPSKLETVLQRIAVALQLPAEAQAQLRSAALRLVDGLGVEQLSGGDAADGSDSEAGVYVVFARDEPEIHFRWWVGTVRHAERNERKLSELFGASLARVRPVLALFSQKDASAGFLSLSATLWPPRAPELTAHLNPGLFGALNAPGLIEQALEVLGLSAAWHGVSRAMPRGPELDQLTSLSVALAETSEAAVEIRIQHREASIEILESALGVAPGADTSQLVGYLRSCLDPGQEVPAGLESALRFTTRSGAAAASAGLYVPVRGSQRVGVRALEALGSARSVLALAASGGVESVRSVFLQSPPGRMSVQLSEPVDDVGSAQVRKASKQAVPAVEQMVTEYEASPLSLHPFFQRMGRQAVDVSHMWLMFSNIYAGLSQHFPRRLAWVIFGVEDERIRSVLTEQLHEELGAGDYTQAHRRLFLKLLDALAPWQPPTIEAKMKLPGLRLSENLEAAYFDPQPYTGVGAAIVIELLGKQVDQFVADQFRRQQAVGMTSLEWLTLHETLEVDHAHESMDLASYVERDEDRLAAWRGGRAVHAAGWRFFDDMYELCFGT